MEALKFQAEYQGESWEGTIQIDLKTDHHVSAVITARGTPFYVSLATYGSNWCIYVDNFNFGDRAESFVYNIDRWSKHIDNPIDLHSLAYGVDKIFKSN